MKFLKNKAVLFSLFIVSGLVAGGVFVSAEAPYYQENELLNMSELSESDIDEMAAVLLEMQSARENNE